MRDPHRFSWDAEGKHEMFLGHIGQRAIEAVYEVDAGDNFGWPDVESRLDYQNDDAVPPRPDDPGAGREGL